jgi:flagellar biogenesis protein FliO
METARQGLSVLLVFALLGSTLWAVRRRGFLPFRSGFPRRGPVRTRTLEALDRLALTPQHSLHLVRVGECEVLVSTHPQGCALVIERITHGIKQGTIA